MPFPRPSDAQVVEEVWTRVSRSLGYNPLSFRLADLILSQLSTQQPLTLFVATDGNDLNPGTVERPFRTIQAAVDSVPRRIRHPVTINVGAGNFDGFAVNDFAVDYDDPAVGAFMMLSGTLANSTVATGSATGTVTSAASGSTGVYSTVTDTTQSWTVNNLRGKLLAITGGTGAGQVFAIASNTATQITLATTFITTVPDATSTYAIQEPATNINTIVSRAGSAPTPTLTASACIYTSNFRSKGDSTLLLFRNLKVSPPNTGGVRIGDNTATTFDACIFSATGSTPNIANSGNAGFGRISFTNCIFTTTGTSTHIQLGSQTGVGGAGNISRSVFIGGTGISLAGLTNVFLQGLHFYTTGTAIRSTGMFYSWQSNSIKIDGGSVGISANGLQAGVGQLYMQINGGVDISNTTTAIELIGPYNTIVMSGGSGNVTGTGNTTAISLSRGSKFQYSASSTLTGTTEIVLDGTNQTVAALRAASPRLLTNTYGTLIFE